MMRISTGVRMVSFAVFCAIASHARAQPVAAETPDSAAWGDPVQGVQLQVAVAKNARAPLPGQLPRLDLQLRNTGSGTITYNILGLGGLSRIEIDGVWYVPGSEFHNWTLIGDLAPGAQSPSVPLSLNRLLEADPKGAHAVGRKLVLIPGKHTVRVKTFDGSLGVHNAAQQTITLVSNVITIETTAASRPVAR